MMIKRALTIAAALATSAAGTCLVQAQGYIAAPNSAYSRDPAYPPGGYLADDPRVSRRAAEPDFDALDEDEAPQGRRAVASPGPVLSPDDPRYGRPAAPSYSDRGPPPGYSDRGPPVYLDREPPAVIYSDRPSRLPPGDYSDRNNSDRNSDDSFSRGLRPPEAVGRGGNGVTGSVAPAQPGPAPQDGRPVQLSALPPEEQPDVAPAQLPPHLRRQEVNFPTKEPAGTLIVDTPNTYLYYVLGGGRAVRYGVRVGRDGFTWTGVQKVSRKAEWPDWHPPTEMIERQPYLPRFMAGGPGNPLGARAMYLGATVYRIHGTNQPSTIGKFVSSGCIGMLNEDVSDLFDRVKVGTRVVVMPGGGPAVATTAAAQAAPGNYSPAPQNLTPQAYNVPGTQPTAVPALPAPVTVR